MGWGAAQKVCRLSVDWLSVWQAAVMMSDDERREAREDVEAAEAIAFGPKRNKFVTVAEFERLIKKAIARRLAAEK